ncbi:MAG: hypothetical protein U9Q03_03770 [Patescibacteria group bacterium]|nr:hypothetical protein [Patescibacteria group bacterium]
MKSKVFQFASVLVLAVLHASFFTAFGHPVSLINLPLVLIVSLAVGLRATPAVVAAVLAGAVMDTLSPVAFGTYILAMIVVSAVVVLSLSTVLTHLSFFSYLGANAGAFLIFHTVVFLINASGRLLAGQAMVPPGLKSAFIAVMIALPIQLLICAVIRLMSGRFRKRLSDPMALR